MKTALCLSGQIRSHHLVKESIKKHVIDVYNCDVFCHFWHKYDNEKFKNFYNSNCGYDYGRYDSKKIDDVINFYNPVSLKYSFPFIKQNTKSALYSRFESNKLKTEYEKNNNMKYDLVIKCRFDMLFKSDLKIQEIEENTVYLLNRPGGCGGYADWVVYGNSQIMDSYMNVYEEYKDKDRILQPCTEGIYGEYLNGRGIAVKYIERVFSIVREDGFEIR